ncbi:MAG TPA: hypothetical protein GX711_07215, partial [Clostridia bacterium]|nr:hypothetical protein [Clostridia bacterium]
MLCLTWKQRLGLEVQRLPKNNVLVGLDIGTSKVAAVIAEIDVEGPINIVGFGETPSGGLRKGTII